MSETSTPPSYLTGLPDDLVARIRAERTRFEARCGPIAERRVLIVGGSGYIGGPVTSALLRAGLKVRNLDLNLYGNGGTITPFLFDPNYDWIPADLASGDALERALHGVTDVVILAGLVGDPITKKYPEASEAINDKGIIRCIEALNGRSLNKVLFISTCSNYGMIEGDELATEATELKPLSLYAKAKVAAETYLLSQRGKVDYSPVVLRFATAFGFAPRMRFDLTVNEFTRDIFLRRDMLVYDAHTWRPYCHVRDFARVIGRVLDFPVEDVAFEVFNAGGDINNHTKQSIVDLVCARLPGREIGYKEHGTDPRNYRVSFEKVRDRLHFTPAYSVEMGIEEIVRALETGLLDDVDQRRNFYGNYELSYQPAA